MQQRSPWWVWLLPLPLVWWASAGLAIRWNAAAGLAGILAAVNDLLAQPFPVYYTTQTPRFLLLGTVLYAAVSIVITANHKNTRPGEEHGSARWGNVFALNRKYQDRAGPNLLMTRHFRIGVDGYKHKHNTNILVVGGSGAGKTRTYAVPNVLEAARAGPDGKGCSLVITDPKAEILRKTGRYLLQQGYEVRVFDLINPSASFCYNPFVYVKDDKDVLQLISNLIQNTTPPHAQSSDPFWEKSETALLQALMLYLLHEAPPEEQNFGMVMELLESAEVREEDETYQSPLDVLFERLEEREPDSIAVKQYRVFKQAAGKTAKSILVSVGVRLAAFNLPQINRLTMTDELHLDELGERRVALFCCIPDSDKSLNYLVGMVYTQLIQTLYRQADRVYKGRLPVPVHCLMDEFPNVALPKDSFLSALATMRSRGIFCSIIVQNISQLKAMYKDNWESLIGLCDEFLYLGGNEQSTHKYVSELIGKETVGTTSHSRSRGHSGSYSTSQQQAARDLLTPDEVRLLPDGKAVLFVRGERPVIDDKYDLLRHPCIRFTEDVGAPPYDYTTAKQAADDLPGDAQNWELLDMDDFLPQANHPQPPFRMIHNKTQRRSAHESQKTKPTG
ncbi:MAG: VirD4-like conjugal transfer protein, CD1115 family [Gemmiger sp.]